MTDRIHARRVPVERREKVHATFDAIDTKGRRFGAWAYIEVYDCVEAEYAPNGHGYYLITPDRLGRWFHVVPHATRDGQSYGAWQSGKAFRTEDEAHAYIAKYFVDAEKRALKNKNRAA